MAIDYVYHGPRKDQHHPLQAPGFFPFNLFLNLNALANTTLSHQPLLAPTSMVVLETRPEEADRMAPLLHLASSRPQFNNDFHSWALTISFPASFLEATFFAAQIPALN